MVAHGHHSPTHQDRVLLLLLLLAGLPKPVHSISFPWSFPFASCPLVAPSEDSSTSPSSPCCSSFEPWLSLSCSYPASCRGICILRPSYEPGSSFLFW